MVEPGELRKQVLLEDLEDNELKIIAERVVELRYSEGEFIFKEGEETEGVFLVKKGKVEISKKTPDGWKQTLAVLPEGHFFGELSVIEDKRYHGADARAVNDVELYLIKKEAFKRLEETHPRLMYKIMKRIAKVASSNVHNMNDKLVKLLISY